MSIREITRATMLICFLLAMWFGTLTYALNPELPKRTLAFVDDEQQCVRPVPYDFYIEKPEPVK